MGQQSCPHRLRTYSFQEGAGLIGRLTMSQQGRWLAQGDTLSELEHKLGECVWWLIILAERMDVDLASALGNFLTETGTRLGE
ncbi:hypothetical protein HYD27_14205 [Paenibacillus sp. S150]|nr:hypothetical protein [Paenibacillus sp. S150]